MKKDLILLSIFFLVLVVSIGISFLGPKDIGIEWGYFNSSQYEQYGITIHETLDKGFLLGATTYTENNKCDILVIKINEQLEKEWQRYYGGSSFDYLEDIVLMPDGGFIALTDSSSQDAGESELIGGRDVWIFKADKNGNILWEKNYGGTGDDFPMSIIQTTDNGFLVTGYTHSDDHHFQGNHGKKDSFVMKLDSQGSVEWSRLYGGFDNEEAVACVEVEDGYIIAAETNSVDTDVSKQRNNRSIWLFKLDKEGNILWNKAFQRDEEQGVSAMVAAPDGGFLLGGFTSAKGYNPEDIYLMKTDDNGYFEWEKIIGGEDRELLFGLTATKDGHFVLGGTSGSKEMFSGKNLGSWDIWVVELDSTGEIQRTKQIGGSGYEEVLFLGATRDDDILIAGLTDSKNGSFEGIKSEKISSFYFKLSR